MSRDKTSNLKQKGFLRKGAELPPFLSRLTTRRFFEGAVNQPRQINATRDEIGIPPATTQRSRERTQDHSRLKSERQLAETDNPVFGISLGILVGAILWFAGIIAVLRIF